MVASHHQVASDGPQDTDAKNRWLTVPGHPLFCHLSAYAHSSWGILKGQLRSRSWCAGTSEEKTVMTYRIPYTMYYILEYLSCL